MLKEYILINLLKDFYLRFISLNFNKFIEFILFNKFILIFILFTYISILFDRRFKRKNKIFILIFLIIVIIILNLYEYKDLNLFIRELY
jgi:hypothetical protein